MSILTCSIEGCTSPVHVKKRVLCKSHYNRWIYSGSTEMLARPASCLTCGLPNPSSKAKGPAPAYCSALCRRKAHYTAFKASDKYDERLARARRGKVTRLCLHCRGEFEAAQSIASYCSPRCYNKYMDANNPVRCSADSCERGVRAKGLCNMHWRRKARAEGREQLPAWDERRKANSQKRRAQKLGTQTESLLPIDIFERDIWLCGLCMAPVDPDLAHPDPMSASLDHIVPLSKGGTHTYENVQLAHLTCNVSKGNRIAV